jgi:DNA-binding ferritin-like protein
VDRTSRKRLAKAQTAVANAKRNVAIATKQLSEAVRALLHSRTGSSKEAQKAKSIRATTKDFVAARTKLRKAEKKRKKVAARLRKTTARGKK